MIYGLSRFLLSLYSLIYSSQLRNASQLLSMIAFRSCQLVMQTGLAHPARGVRRWVLWVLVCIGVVGVEMKLRISGEGCI